MAVRLKRHYAYSVARTDLWSGHLVDRDRTTERIELGLRVHEALTATPHQAPCLVGPMAEEANA